MATSIHYMKSISYRVFWTLLFVAWGATATCLTGCSCSDTENGNGKIPELTIRDMTEEEKIVNDFFEQTEVSGFYDRDPAAGSQNGGELVISQAEDDEFLRLIEIAPPGLYEADLVRVTSPKLTDRTIQHVAKFKDAEALFLDSTQLTDAGLVHLKDLKKLRDLSLNETRISDAGLRHLSALPDLRSLSLTDTLVSDAGLAHVAKMPKLESLVISGTRVSDAGLIELSALKSLRSLNVENTRVTADGAKQLKAVLPELGIFPPFLIDPLPPIPPRPTN